MKMTKKFLLGGAVLLAATMMFTGCPKLLGNDIFDYTDATYESANGTASVNYDNTEGDSIKRGIRFLKTKRTGVTAIVTIENQTNDSLDGMLGIAFGALENNKVWDFCVAGTQCLTGKGNAYISSFHNIYEDNFDSSNFGAWDDSNNTSITKSKYDKNVTTSYEIEISSYSSKTPQYVKSVTQADGTYSIAVQILPNDKEDGGYKVSYYKTDDIDENGKVKDGASPIFSKNVENTATGLDNSEQKLGFYANIYKGKSLKGSIKLLDVQGNPIPIEWEDDTIASPLFN